MKKRKLVIFLALIFVITSIGYWEISRNKEDITRTDVERILDLEGFVSVEETSKAENQSSNLPKVFWDIINQYNEIIEAGIDDVGQEFFQKNFVVGERRRL